MEYTKQNFVDDKPLSAAQLNHMEEGIANSYTANDKKLAAAQKDIIDSLCPFFESAGGIVQIRPVERYPLSVVSPIAPSTMGHSAITLTQCGKNLYDKDAYPFTGSYVHHGMGSMHASTTCCGTKDFIPVAHLAGQTVTLNHPPKEVGAGNPGAAFYDKDRVYITGYNDYTMTVPENAAYMRFSVPLAYLDGVGVQLELGSAVTEYEPYTEKTYTAEPDTACQGGSFDWNTGILTVTHEKVDMASLDWQYSEENCYFYADLADGAVPDVGKANDAISNAFTWEPDTYGDITSGGVLHGGFFDISDEHGICRIAVACWDADTVGTFLDILTGTDAMLVYPLAQPITLECGARIIAAKSGTNTLYSSTGDTQVAGRADPVAQTKHLEERIAALEAAITNL